MVNGTHEQGKDDDLPVSGDGGLDIWPPKQPHIAKELCHYLREDPDPYYLRKGHDPGSYGPCSITGVSNNLPLTSLTLHGLYLKFI